MIKIGDIVHVSDWTGIVLEIHNSFEDYIFPSPLIYVVNLKDYQFISIRENELKEINGEYWEINHV